MAGRTYLFDSPDRFVAGAVGEPGHRTFFLQAAKGRAVTTVALEKVQVASLAERIGLLAREREGAQADTVETGASGEARLLAPPPALQEPLVEAFRVGSMTLTYDEEGRHVTVEAQEIDGRGPSAEVVASSDRDAAPRLTHSVATSFAAGDADDDDDAELDVLRVRLPLDEAVRFAEGALQVVAAGRLPCPLCGEPLDPQGHICVRRNGYVM